MHDRYSKWMGSAWFGLNEALTSAAGIHYLVQVHLDRPQNCWSLQWEARDCGLDRQTLFPCYAFKAPIITYNETKWQYVMFNSTRTPGSNHGGTRQSGGAVQRRITTRPSARGVGSRTKEASGARSRNSSKRSKTDDALKNVWGG